MTNAQIAELIRRALWRLRRCPAHLVELDRNGRVCSLCIVERASQGREFPAIVKILER